MLWAELSSFQVKWTTTIVHVSKSDRWDKRSSSCQWLFSSKSSFINWTSEVHISSNQLPELKTMVYLLTSESYNFGYTSFIDWSPYHILYQKVTIRPSPISQWIWSLKFILSYPSLKSILIKSLHQIDYLLFLLPLSFTNIFRAWFWHLWLMIPYQTASLNTKILQFHLRKKALLKSSIFLIPIPLSSFGLQTLCKPTQWMVFLSSESYHRKLLWIL